MSKKLSLKQEIAKVLACTPSARARGIIDSPYTGQILEQLPPQETYLIIKESWGMDSQILLQYILPEAVCRFIDLDCWEKDTLSVDGVMEWLWEIYNASFDTLAHALETIDLEILVILFQSYIKVAHVIPTDEHIPDLIDEGFESLDNNYFYQIILDDEKTPLIKELLSILFTHHQELYYTILEGVMFEMRSNMEETTYEKRSLRLMEMGFPPPDEAMSIYQHIRPEKLLDLGIQKEKTPVINKHLHLLPTVYLDHFSHKKDLIIQVLDSAKPEIQERFLYEMIYLANKIVMADFKPLNEMEEIRRSMEKASSLTSLGLSVAMREKGLSAEAVLDSINAEPLFSLGYNMIYEQQRRLKLLLQEIESTMIPESLREHVDGLQKKRPLYKDRDFSTIEELEEVKGSIDRMEAMASLLSHLRWDEQIEYLSETNTGANLDMETIILTSLAAGGIEQETRFRPLELHEILHFLSRTTHLEAGKRSTVPTFKEDLKAYLSGLDNTLGDAMIGNIASLLITRLEDEISGINNLDRLDPRFITCFTVKMPTP
jgi:hypothetical protein